MASDAARDEMLLFLKHKHVAENGLFYLENRRLSEAPGSLVAKSARAAEIFELYIEENAALELNLPENVRTVIRRDSHSVQTAALAELFELAMAEAVGCACARAARFASLFLSLSLSLSHTHTHTYTTPHTHTTHTHVAACSTSTLTSL